MITCWNSLVCQSVPHCGKSKTGGGMAVSGMFPAFIYL
jgi:hypothetical protein